LSQTMQTNPGPLQGLRVIELAHMMAGPVCGLMLADMGADVIKLEKTNGGDDTRRSVPPAINGESAAFMMMNRNKRGIVVDLKHTEGRDVLRRLVQDADVLIENYRAETMPGLGLGYDDLKVINPRLIYAAISGFGRTGPLAAQGGFDLVAQGMSGLMSITGEAAGRPPVKVGAPVCDITAGILLSMGILAAVVNRARTGHGQMVDTSLFEAGITHTYWQSAIAMATGVSPGPMGSAHPLNAPYQAFETLDGWISVGAANQANWQAMLRAFDIDTLGRDPRFAEGKARMTNLTVLIETLNPHFKRRTTAEVLHLPRRSWGAGRPGIVDPGNAHAPADGGALDGAGNRPPHRRSDANNRSTSQVLSYPRRRAPRGPAIGRTHARGLGTAWLCGQ
jgi:crotonobetainyl-CoA:carnitine CoA-transferase CaiB-like acyl-CoA transferase